MPREAFRQLLVALLLAVLAGCGADDRRSAVTAPASTAVSGSVEILTSHYAITATADQRTTDKVGAAAEALFSSYTQFFDPSPSNKPSMLRLRLYATREEFQAHNRSRPWAEAYYVDGVCHAYLDTSKPNPYHWLLHEAVHQLNRELTGYAKDKWINEGLATYFGSSRYTDGVLHAGEMDLDAYPLWWLKRWELSGDWATDVQARQVIPLRALITGQGGPPLDATVNAHYLGWWSLSHFLLHHDDGRYAAGYRHLIQHGGSLVDFERHIGPLPQVEAEWYAYLQARITEQRVAGP